LSETIRSIEENFSKETTGIKDIDALLEGGLPTTHSTFLVGSPGTMKTSLSLTSAYEKVLRKKHNVLYISLDQSFASIINQMKSLGLNLVDISIIRLSDLGEFENIINKINVFSDVGCLIIADNNCFDNTSKAKFSGEEDTSWINIIKNLIKKIIVEVHLEDLYLDSVDVLNEISSFKKPMIHLRELKLLTKEKRINSWFISESFILDDPASRNSFLLADSIFFVERKIVDRKSSIEFSIPVCRHSKHDTKVHTLIFEEGEFHLRYGGEHPKL